MPFWRSYYHIVWATKNREALIQPELEPRLFAYIVRKAAELDAYIYALNGWFDHVHLVTSIPPKIAVSHFVKDIKGSSSHDLNLQGLEYKFAWQRGYGVLTLGQTQLVKAIAYVNEQKQHHRGETAIPWLEHCSEINEGPEDHGLTRSHVPALKEEAPVDNILGDPAF